MYKKILKSIQDEPTNSKESSHPAEMRDPDTKLIHYSKNQGMTILDPKKEAKKPKPPAISFYLEGAQPDPSVMSGTRSKYVSILGHHKLYDIGKDSENIHKDIEEELRNKRKPFDRKRLYKTLKHAGYSGIYNSNMNKNRSKIVVMFVEMPIESEYNITPTDKKITSSTNYGNKKESHAKAKEFVKKEGHGDHRFLGNLLHSARKGK